MIKNDRSSSVSISSTNYKIINLENAAITKNGKFY